MELAHHTSSPKGFCVVLVTASSEEEATTIGRTLVERKLAACANVLPGIRSIFRWKGKVTEEKEVLLLVKSRIESFDEIEKAVKGLHSYEVPEVIAIDVVKGSSDYLNWMIESTSK